jgi:ABC-2 type transport system permease protein
MPGWLQGFVKVNPITHLVDAIRSVMAGTPDGMSIMWTLLWSAGFVLVFGFLTMYRYNRR